MDYLVTTPCGQLRGTDGRTEGMIAFKGIRYATAGRWEYPRQVTGWEGIYDATAYGHCSYQPRSFYNEEENLKKVFYYHEFRKGETYSYSEDCLFLNVWVPRNASAGDNLPVVVYIHGGGFTGGCGHEKHFDGPVWPEQGVIGVTLNYRLGPMGFVCLPELADEAGHTGNYAMYDQMTAIKWVKDNIAAFGGDPENITIMGQSAGAASVQMLCMSPLTEGLFQKAVMSSGCGLGGMMGGSTPEKRYDFWKAVQKLCGCESLAQFRAVEPEKLFSAWQEAKKQVKGGGMAAAPVTDGVFAVKGAQAHKIPYMVGSNSHDIMPPILYNMGRKFCTKRETPCYLWYFERNLPGDGNGAWHSADLWYWFGTLNNCWRPMEEQDYKLSAQMAGYLCNFAKTADPNGDGLPRWTGIKEKKTLLLGDGDTALGKPKMGKMIRIMLTNKAVGE